MVTGCAAVDVVHRVRLGIRQGQCRESSVIALTVLYVVRMLPTRMLPSGGWRSSPGSCGCKMPWPFARRCHRQPQRALRDDDTPSARVTISTLELRPSAWPWSGTTRSCGRRLCNSRSFHWRPVAERSPWWPAAGRQGAVFTHSSAGVLKWALRTLGLPTRNLAYCC